MTITRNPRKFDFGASTGEISDIAIYFILFIYLVYSLVSTLGSATTDLVGCIILFLNGMCALFGLHVAMRGRRTLFVVFFLFNFLFLSLAPLQQTYARTDQVFEQGDLVTYAAFMCLIFNLGGVGFVLRPLDSSRTTQRESFLSTTLLGSNPITLLVLLLVTGALLAFLVGRYGAALFSNRQTLNDLIASDGDKSSTIFIYSFLHPFVFTSSFIGLMVAYRQKLRLLTFLFLFSLAAAFLVNNPIIQARFRSSTLLVFMALVLTSWKNVRLVMYVIFAGIAASPIYNAVFRLTFGGRDDRELATFFAQMDFDALNIFCYTIRWVSDRGLEFGTNLTGAFFFFVPRSLWEDKGKHVANLIFTYLKEYRGYTSDNLSSPPPVEGYLSFGLVGAISLSLIVVWAIDFVERRGNRAEYLSPWHLILCLSPMLTMILLRGPLQVGFSEWTLHACTILITATILRIVPRTTARGYFKRKLAQSSVS